VVLCYDITLCSQKSLEQNLAMHDGLQQVLNKFTLYICVTMTYHWLRSRLKLMKMEKLQRSNETDQLKTRHEQLATKRNPQEYE
jgi:hypothetical protein